MFGAAFELHFLFAGGETAQNQWMFCEDVTENAIAWETFRLDVISWEVS